MQRSVWLRSGLAVAMGLALLLGVSSAQAATRSMVGSLGVVNPSTAPPFFFGGGPGIAGKKFGPYAPTTGFKTISVSGATTSTFVGRGVTVPANLLNFSSTVLRDFPAFPGVANLTDRKSVV